MKKKVNITSAAPLVHFPIPVQGTVLGMDVEVNIIKLCLENGALIREVLPNGEELKLDFTNYNTVNFTEEAAAKVETVAVEEKIEKAEEVEAPAEKVEEAAEEVEDPAEKVEEAAEEVEAPAEKVEEAAPARKQHHTKK